MTQGQGQIRRYDAIVLVVIATAGGGLLNEVLKELGKPVN